MRYILRCDFSRDGEDGTVTIGQYEELHQAQAEVESLLKSTAFICDVANGSFYVISTVPEKIGLEEVTEDGKHFLAYTERFAAGKTHDIMAYHYTIEE